MFSWYGDRMPLRVLEHVIAWKQRELANAALLRAAVPGLEPPYVRLLRDWEAVFASTLEAARSTLRASLATANAGVRPPGRANASGAALPGQADAGGVMLPERTNAGGTLSPGRADAGGAVPAGPTGTGPAAAAPAAIGSAAAANRLPAASATPYTASHAAAHAPAFSAAAYRMAAELSGLTQASRYQSREFIRQLHLIQAHSAALQGVPAAAALLAHIRRDSELFLDTVDENRVFPAKSEADPDAAGSAGSAAGGAGDAKPEAGEPEATGRGAHGPEAAEPETAGQRTTEPETAGSPTARTEAKGSSGPGPSSPEPAGPEPSGAGSPGTGLATAGTATSDAETRGGDVPGGTELPDRPPSATAAADGGHPARMRDDSADESPGDAIHAAGGGPLRPEGSWSGAFTAPAAVSPVPIGGHTLPPLPYPYNALEPYIDETTMRLHHDRHHRSYVEGLNRAEKKLEEARRTGDFGLVKHWERELAFHGAGHYLHTLFWETMTPHGGGRPEGELAGQIARDFGGLDAFRRHFAAAAEKVEGGGWAILVWSPRSRRLEILTAEKHQNLSQWDVVPLLPLDVWEHAYYLKHQNDRAAYIRGWWHVVNWPKVAERFRRARALQWPPS